MEEKKRNARREAGLTDEHVCVKDQAKDPGVGWK